MATRWAALNLLGLTCGFVGALFLSLTLTLTSSNYRLVEPTTMLLSVSMTNWSQVGSVAESTLPMNHVHRVSGRVGRRS
jgi:hypothetical protein